MILEYKIPAGGADDIKTLANAWHALASPDLMFPSEAYNTKLQAITDIFTKRDAAPGRPNGSAIGQIRTNDFFTLGEWEFREFHLSATTGHLEPAGLAQIPDVSFNGTDTLADFINANADTIMTGTHEVPATFEGQPFQAGSNVTDFNSFRWVANVTPDLREKFATNTCNGCHTGFETGAFIFQINPRSQGQESQLSGFLTGSQEFDPFANLFRNFNELGRRGRILHDLVCPDDPLPPPPPDTSPGPGGTAGTGGGFDGGDPGTGTAGTGGSFDGGFAGTGGSSTGAAGAGGGTMPPPPPPPGK
jgi:hypothetical protein